MGDLKGAGRTGSLPSEARWHLGSRLVFLKKKTGPAPHPVCAGEVLRRALSKGLLREQEATVRRLMLRLRQYGVMVPEGVEGLIHARTAIERLAASGALGSFVALGLDFVNCFCTCEWPAIREAYAEHHPDLLPPSLDRMVHRGARSGVATKRRGCSPRPRR